MLPKEATVEPCVFIHFFLQTYDACSKIYFNDASKLKAFDEKFNQLIK